MALRHDPSAILYIVKNSSYDGLREVHMHHFTLLLGMGTALVAASACAATPRTPLTSAAAANDADAIRGC